MSARTPSGPAGPTGPAGPAAPPVVGHGWVQALGTVLAGLVAMGAVAALGLWAAGAADLPDNAFPRVVAATVVTAVGGALEMSGDAEGLAETDAGLAVLPLSVTLTGALVIARGFLRPLRHRAVAGPAELAGWAGRIAFLWLLALLGAAFAARQTFEVSLGEGVLSDLGDLFGVAPRVGFTTDVPLTVLFGLLWLAGVFVLALLVAREAPLPGRLPALRASARPVACAMVALLLAYVVLGAVVALVVAGTRGHPADTFAVLLLGLPNLAWLALTVGLGATWNGRVEGPFGLPVPHALDEVLRTPDVSTVNLGTLSDRDGRMWWLLVVAAVLVLAAGFLVAYRSAARTPLWLHAVRTGVALALTVLVIGLVGRVSADYGLSVLGIGDLGGGLSGQVFLRPRLRSAVGLALLWGLVAGTLGALLARWVGRRSGRAPSGS
ncbi:MULTISPECIES: streptophobe family protein [Streptomyces]|uniref:streptophobe family protein n=1 Tax=Streptomyces TaxID=1883 RepID=UPI001CCEA55B|nr:streptophobe family protein [Streptomyces olivaceus]MBZ6169098.1 streptophobe family protein [Streptomyces olivaceus]MBZ6176134.1 streptophobe family protein [Streptomyces olivaceus]MBZ6182666.1 streptophobe family protein [Streptomyces olivaceus]